MEEKIAYHNPARPLTPFSGNQIGLNQNILLYLHFKKVVHCLPKFYMNQWKK